MNEQTQHFEQFIKAGLYLRGWSSRTPDVYRRAFASFQQSLVCSPTPPACADGSLNKALLEAWVIWMREKGLSPSCINIGQQMRYRNAYRDLKAVFAKAGVTGDHIHPHALRHCFACNWVKRGGNVYTLSRILGHSNISITGTYLRGLGVADFSEEHARLSMLARG
jgi:site-specific recombinase XerD